METSYLNVVEANSCAQVEITDRGFTKINDNILSIKDILNKLDLVVNVDLNPLLKEIKNLIKLIEDLDINLDLEPVMGILRDLNLIVKDVIEEIKNNNSTVNQTNKILSDINENIINKNVEVEVDFTPLTSLTETSNKILKDVNDNIENQVRLTAIYQNENREIFTVIADNVKETNSYITDFPSFADRNLNILNEILKAVKNTKGVGNQNDPDRYVVDTNYYEVHGYKSEFPDGTTFQAHYVEGYAYNMYFTRNDPAIYLYLYEPYTLPKNVWVRVKVRSGSFPYSYRYMMFV